MEWWISIPESAEYYDTNVVELKAVASVVSPADVPLSEYIKDAVLETYIFHNKKELDWIIAAVLKEQIIIQEKTVVIRVDEDSNLNQTIVRAIIRYIINQMHERNIDVELGVVE